MKTNKRELTSCHGLSRLIVTSLCVVVNYLFREIQHGLRMIHHSFRTSTGSLCILNMETFDCFGYRFCLERQTVANNGTGETIYSVGYLHIHWPCDKVRSIFYTCLHHSIFLDSLATVLSSNRISFISTRLTMNTIVWDYLQNIYTKIMHFPLL